MSSLGQALGEVVRLRRQEKGLSQEALADLAGIHRTYISAIELGKVRVGLDVAKRLADALGVSLAVLIEDAEARLR